MRKTARKTLALSLAAVLLGLLLMTACTADPSNPSEPAGEQAGGQDERPSKGLDEGQSRDAAPAQDPTGHVGPRGHSGDALRDLRHYGIGAQILRDCGVRRMQVLGTPLRLPGMAGGYGLEVTGYLTQPGAANSPEAAA